MNPVVIALATQRLTQLVTEDTLTEPVRRRINNWAYGAPEFSLRERVAVLTSCDACMSVWAAAAVLVASHSRVTRPLVGILAASGAALIVRGVRDKLEV